MPWPLPHPAPALLRTRHRTPPPPRPVSPCSALSPQHFPQTVSLLECRLLLEAFPAPPRESTIYPEAGTLRLAGRARHGVVAPSLCPWPVTRLFRGLRWVCPPRTCLRGALPPVASLRLLWATPADSPNEHDCGAGRGLWARPDLAPSWLCLSVTSGQSHVCEAGGWEVWCLGLAGEVHEAVCLGCRAQWWP